jgi:lysyl-tRNA synthetase class 1
LLRILALHEEVVAVILPTLGAERAATYSPFLPIHPRTGRVMQVRIERCDTDAGTIAWQDPEDGRHYETPVTGGACKLQWKADWAMRWAALGVDYEMSGKDLIDSVRLSGRICRILGTAPPESFTYELFLDESGQKISKSKGNGLSVDEWLRYAPPESLGQFMFNQPQRAKRLYFDVIPKAVDEYVANAAKAQTQDDAAILVNPAWHIHGGQVPRSSASPLSFAMLLNLASVVNAETPEILWGFIRRYSPGASPEDTPFLAKLVDCALAYYADFVRPSKQFREPDAVERAALEDLATVLRATESDTTAEDVQTILYDIGKRHPFPELRAWFSCLYQVLLGQSEGPRFGQFVALYGVTETVSLIETALARTRAAA